MKLITKAIEAKLLKNNAAAVETGESADVAPLKIFDPYGRFTMYVFDMDADGRMFGFVVSPLGPDCDEWGYSDLAEIQSLTKFGRPRIERDKWFDGITKEQIANREYI